MAETKFGLKEIEANVIEIIINVLDPVKLSVTPDKKLKEDLGADSVDELEIIMQIEDYYGIDISDKELENENPETVRQIADFIFRKVNPIDADSVTLA